MTHVGRSIGGEVCCLCGSVIGCDTWGCYKYLCRHSPACTSTADVSVQQRLQELSGEFFEDWHVPVFHPS